MLNTDFVEGTIDTINMFNFIDNYRFNWVVWYGSQCTAFLGRSI